MTAPNWQASAACRDEDPELFFPTNDTGQAAVQAEEAKAVCRTCPVMDTCLAWALEQRQDHGVWGGMTEKERANLRRRLARPTVETRVRTVWNVYADRTVGLGNGHREWVGSTPVTVNGQWFTPMQLAWQCEHGSRPKGTLKATCGHKGCVAGHHLYDRGAVPNGCGTRPGYQAHRARGEEACRRCKNANADGDRRLRNTGTTKQLSPTA